MPRASLRAAVAGGLAALFGFVVLLLVAPEYFAVRGFPLDDAWIHAVYARSVARTGALQYNPGIPAAGETAPLWALVLAPVHLLFRDGAVVVGTKILGVLLHVATAVLAAFVIPDDERRASTPWARSAAAILVGVHPDLVAASVSGMEVPLANVIVLAAIVSAQQARAVPLAILSALAVGARPELAAILVLVPLAPLLARQRPAPRVVLAALLGTVVGALAYVIHDLRASGKPLPSTYYAKAFVGPMSVVTAQLHGFGQLLTKLAGFELLLSVLVGAAVVAIAIRGAAESARKTWAAATWLLGLSYVVISFVLVPPIDGAAFYHQRYVLPALPLLLAALPHLVDEAVPTQGKWSLLVPGILVLDLLRLSPARYARLANDAHNIDDVQVREGKTLASASASDVAWVVDAGAVRYFGNAFVVDLAGLNTPQVLGPEASSYLDAHPPRFLELVPTWSSMDPKAFAAIPAMVVRPTTPYTVTSFLAMSQHWLGRCPGGTAGVYTMRGRRYPFHCPPETAP